MTHARTPIRRLRSGSIDAPDLVWSHREPRPTSRDARPEGTLNAEFHRLPRGLQAVALATLASFAPAVGGATPGPTEGSPLPPVGTFATAGLSHYASAEGLAASPTEVQLRAAWSPTAAGTPALACTAREYAARFAVDGADPTPGVVAALAEHCGLPSAPPDVFAFTSPSVEAALSGIAKAPEASRRSPGALGAVVHPGGAVTVAVATPPSGVVLDPLPRTRTPGARLGGRRSANGGALYLYSAVGARDVQVRPVVTGPEGRFDIELPGVVAADGIARHELVRSEGPFLRSLAVLRLHPGALPARYPTPPAPMAHPGRDGLDAQLLAAVNARRQEAGRSPLTPLKGAAPPLDAWLDAVSAGASGAQPPPIVDDRAWTFARLRYAFTAGVTPQQAIDDLRDTPLGRVSLLDAEDTAIAFGVRPFGGAAGHDVVVASLVRFFAPALEAGRGELLTVVNGRRKTAGLPTLQASPVLDAVAQQLADQAQIDADAWGRLVPVAGAVLSEREVDAGAFGAGGLTLARWTPADVLQEQALLRKDMHAIGVGLSVGPLPGQNTPHITLVYVVTDRVPARRQ